MSAVTETPQEAAETSLESQAAQAEAAQAARDSQELDDHKELKRLAVRGSLFEIASYGTGQVLRLASNLLLSRLLFPEAFGLVALVQIFNQGLVMLSDVGIEPAVIQSPLGDEERYLNTAFTMQAVRGLALWGVAIVIAWPMAYIYKEPQLSWLTVVGSAAVAITGLHSTSLYTLRRKLALGRLTAIEIGSQVMGLVVMIPMAIYWRSAWPLVFGALASALTRMIASHFIKVGYRNRFAYDPESRKAITHFGKWVFGSSVMSFFSRQGDRLLLGSMLGVSELGIYSIAVFLSEALAAVIARVTQGILYPTFSRVHNEGKDRLRDVYYEARLGLDTMAMLSLGALAVLGPRVVEILYDDRYQAAGWMLQAFAFRVATASLLLPCETCLFSMGQTHWGFLQNLGRTLYMVIALPIGWKIAGLHGLVYAAALAEVPLFFVLWPPFYRQGMLRIGKEARAVGLFAVGLAAGWGLDRLLGMLNFHFLHHHHH